MDNVDELDSLGIAAKVRQDVDKYRSHYRKWRTSARHWYDMYAGNQWTAEEISALEQQGRPPITFDRITKIVNCVTGLELQNRQDINCIPFGVEDAGVTDLANSAMKFVRNETEAEDEESEAYEDVLVCGLGFIYTYVDYEIDQEGRIVESRIDPFLGGFDPTARKKNVEDSRYRFIAIKYTKKDFLALFPQAKQMVVDGTNLFDEAEESNQDNRLDYEDNTTLQNTDKGLIEVIYYQCYKLIKIYRIENQVLDAMGQPLLDQQGQPVTRIDELDEESYNLLKDQIQAAGLKVVEQNKRKYLQYIVAGNALLNENSTDAPIDDFSIKVLTGLRDRNTNTWFGIVKLMTDPQRWANKWLSQIMHILNSNAKGGYLYETGAFRDPIKAEENMARPDKNVEVNVGGLAKILPKPQPNYPEGIDRLMQYAMGAINDTSGVPQELLGLTDQNQPGIVENSRKNAGITVLAQFSNALRKFRKDQGKALLMFIQNYLSDGRLIRIDEKNGVKYVPLLKDKLATKYDIIIDDAPTSTNSKDKVFSAMMQLLPLALQANIPVPPEMLDYAPLPQNLIDDWKEYIAQQTQPTPEAELNKVLDLQMKDGQAKKLKSDALLNQAKAEDIRNKSNLEAKGGQQSLQDNIINMGIEKIKQQSSQVKAMAEIHKANTSADIAKIKLAESVAKMNKPQQINQQ